MTEIARKLAELGYYTFMERPKGIDEPLVAELKRLGVDLPDDYAAFLTEFPETGMFDRMVGFRGRNPSPWADRDGVESLEALFGRCRSDYSSWDILYLRDLYLDEFRPTYLAIGDMPGSNRIVMSCAGKDKGRIYTWDCDQNPGLGKGFYLAFDDFSSFINALFEEEEVPIETRPSEQAEREHDGVIMRIRNIFRLGKNKR